MIVALPAHTHLFMFHAGCTPIEFEMYSLCFVLFFRISTPLSMHMFAWSKSQATLYIGLMLGGAGIVSIVVFVFIKILSKR